LGKELLPILIRPITRDFNSSYFELKGIDSGNNENWDITVLSNF